ncbi:hypothetical protein [Marinoscillum sp. MHG1-6]|uniref:hypothetical protein n=1 Tax=Marinoscillum sp. MHG1-6 TaxID=2959627 RepID=UPI0021578931|nr:hypothetical protein [Marinoscillum sp. MHG1-6]
MRTQLICLLIFITISKAMSQQALEQKLSIEFVETDSQTAINELMQASGWKFSYNPDFLPELPITKSYSDKTMGYILNDLLGDGFQYKIRGSYLIIQHFPVQHEKKSMNVKGRVVDAITGVEIPDVSVYEVNHLTASLTRQDGTYEITAPTINKFTVLAISKENYQDTVIRISELEQNALTLELRPQTSKPDSNDDSRFFKLLKNKEAKKHNRNISLQEVRPVQFSLLPVAGTNGVLSGKVANNFSLNLVAGYSHSLRGVEIGGAVNIEKADVKGVQIAGASNLVGSRVKGVQIAGATNTNLNEASGVIIGGAMNSSGAAKGVQIAGAYNYVKYKMEGWQVSGGINYAGELKGVQLGMVNIAKKADQGVMIGVLNISKTGLLRLELENNDLTQYNLNLKSGVYKFYSILSAGISPCGSNPLWGYGMGFGSQILNKEKYYFGAETTVNTLFPLERHISGVTQDQRLALLFGYKFFEHLSINAGPVLHYYIFTNKQPQNQEFYDRLGSRPLAEGNNQKLWIGYRVAIGF